MPARASRGLRRRRPPLVGGVRAMRMVDTNPCKSPGRVSERVSRRLSDRFETQRLRRRRAIRLVAEPAARPLLRLVRHRAQVPAHDGTVAEPAAHRSRRDARCSRSHRDRRPARERRLDRSMACAVALLGRATMRPQRYSVALSIDLKPRVGTRVSWFNPGPLGIRSTTSHPCHRPDFGNRATHLKRLYFGTCVVIAARFDPYPSVPLGLTLIAAFSLNLATPTPAQAALVASLGACRNAKVAYSGVHHHAGRADAVDRASVAVGVTSSATNTRANDNPRMVVILHP